ncbi:hypothetical protein [Halorientalis pallida]|uniref:Lipoprotein n=1 Tax=Halorientalis pallida TaxID=2479928 RepID=A0A498KWV7_9EURY|nr:hypothetical protein [Halorientalis pallida]RXK46222.1 hypothetical protein EAF64_20090 [Halorientalis pallida]
MRRALQTVAVVTLLLAAGCSGPNGQTTTTAPDVAPATPTQTDGSTPDPTTTDRPSTVDGPANDSVPDAKAYPPGVLADGVTNVTALVSAHRSSVVADGATMRTTTRTDGTVDGTAIRIRGNETARLAPTASHLRWSAGATTTRGNETGVLDERYWVNESVLVSRVAAPDGNVTVNVQNRSAALDRVVVSAATKARILRSALSNADYDVRNVTEQDGRTVTTLVARNGTYRGQRPVSTYDATVSVAASGRVLSLDRTWQTANTRYHDEYVWTAATPVEKPAWAPGNATTRP